MSYTIIRRTKSGKTLIRTSRGDRVAGGGAVLTLRGYRSRQKIIARSTRTTGISRRRSTRKVMKTRVGRQPALKQSSTKKVVYLNGKKATRTEVLLYDAIAGLSARDKRLRQKIENAYVSLGLTVKEGDSKLRRLKKGAGQVAVEYGVAGATLTNTIEKALAIGGGLALSRKFRKPIVKELKRAIPETKKVLVEVLDPRKIENIPRLIATVGTAGIGAGALGMKGKFKVTTKIKKTPSPKLKTKTKDTTPKKIVLEKSKFTSAELDQVTQGYYTGEKTISWKKAEIKLKKQLNELKAQQGKANTIEQLNNIKKERTTLVKDWNMQQRQATGIAKTFSKDKVKKLERAKKLKKIKQTEAIEVFKISKDGKLTKIGEGQTFRTVKRLSRRRKMGKMGKRGTAQILLPPKLKLKMLPKTKTKLKPQLEITIKQVSKLKRGAISLLAGLSLSQKIMLKNQLKNKQLPKSIIGTKLESAIKQAVKDVLDSKQILDLRTLTGLRVRTKTKLAQKQALIQRTRLKTRLKTKRLKGGSLPKISMPKPTKKRTGKRKTKKIKTRYTTTIERPAKLPTNLKYFTGFEFR